MNNNIWFITICLLVFAFIAISYHWWQAKKKAARAAAQAAQRPPVKLSPPAPPEYIDGKRNCPQLLYALEYGDIPTALHLLETAGASPYSWGWRNSYWQWKQSETLGYCRVNTFDLFRNLSDHQWQGEKVLLALQKAGLNLAAQDFIIALIVEGAGYYRDSEGSQCFCIRGDKLLPCIKILLRAGANPNLIHNNQPLLQWAGEMGAVGIVTELLNHGAIPPRSGLSFWVNQLQLAGKIKGEGYIALATLAKKFDAQAAAT